MPYFPLDCCLDDKVSLIEAEFGLAGFAVVIKLFQRIYGGEGYYCEWTKEVRLLFSRGIGEGCGLVSEIALACVRRGIFSRELFEKHAILTSEGIQRRFFSAAGRRKCVSVKREYLLLACGGLPKNVVILDGNDCGNAKNDDRSGQRKEEESKEEERKGEDAAPVSDGLERAFGRGLADRYIAKAQKYGRSGDEAVRTAWKWLEEDAAAGRVKRPKKGTEPSFDLDGYGEWVNGYVPVYRPGKGK